MAVGQPATLSYSVDHSSTKQCPLIDSVGSVVKAMDRGADATDTLVTYVFLMLVPALMVTTSI